MDLSRGEPFEVKFSWGLLCFTYVWGIAMTIWGRNGF